MSKVSVVVPSYNSELTLGCTLASVLAQDHQDFECIIVDDGSSDGSSRIAEVFCEFDPRFRLIAQPENGGVVKARNRAIAESSGRFVAFLDSDDLWNPLFLSSSLELSVRRRAGLVHSPYLRFRCIHDGFEGFSVTPPGLVDSSNILAKNFIPLLSVLVDREVVGDFSFPSFRPEDYALWCDLVLSRGFCSVSTGLELAYYRVSVNQRSSNKILALKRLLAFYSQYLGFPSPVAASFVARWAFFNMLSRKRGFSSLDIQANSTLVALHSRNGPS
jgi:teichuronic acid biosynthesis glycosyltransferase TuaG